MNTRPLIMSLDLASTTGVTIGRAGQMPRFEVWKLKLPEDSQDRACRNLGCRLRDEFNEECPDLVVFEVAMNPAVKLRRGDSVASVTLAWMLAGAVGGVCGPFGVRMKRANVQTVRRAVLGQARPESPKELAVAFVNSLGMRTTSHDVADSAVQWLDEVGYRHEMGKRTGGILS